MLGPVGADEMNSLVTISQAAIQVAVGFYDQAEEQKLQSYPTFGRMRSLVTTGVSVPTAEFLTYYLYHRRRPGKPGFRDYGELGRRIHHALTDLEGFVAFNGLSISTVPDVVTQDEGITQHVGESIGLGDSSSSESVPAGCGISEGTRARLGRWPRCRGKKMGCEIVTLPTQKDSKDSTPYALCPIHGCKIYTYDGSVNRMFCGKCGATLGYGGCSECIGAGFRNADCPDCRGKWYECED